MERILLFKEIILCFEKNACLLFYEKLDDKIDIIFICFDVSALC